MPTKRPHTKSRTGCRVCRARRVKCDEVRPVCGQCKKHAVACNYDRIAFISQNVAGQGPSSSSSERKTSTQNNDSRTVGSNIPNALPKPAPFFGQPSNRMIELQLMNHYTVMQLLSSKDHDPKVRTMWACSIPQQAVGSDYLMGAVLSLAALHLHIHRPLDVKMRLISHQCFATALQTMQQQLSNITPTNVPLTFAASVLIQFQTFVSWKDPCMHSSSYELPVQWLVMSQGVRSILRAATVNLGQSVMKPLFDKAPDMSLKKNPLTSDDPFAPIFGLLETPELHEADRAALSNCLHMIHGMYVGIQEGETPTITRRRILTFPARIDQRFIELLRMQEPRAMIVLAHFFAIVKTADDIWWLRGRAEYEIVGITNVLTEAWRPFVTWPQEVIESESQGPSPPDLDRVGALAASAGAERVSEVANMDTHQKDVSTG